MGTPFSMAPPAAMPQPGCAPLGPVCQWSRLRDQLENDAGGWGRGQDGALGSCTSSRPQTEAGHACGWPQAQSKHSQGESVSKQRAKLKRLNSQFCVLVCATPCRVAERHVKLFHNLALEMEVNTEA